MSRAPSAAAGRRPAPSFSEFVLIVALMMALVSISVDNLLPAFAPIRASFGVADENDLQLIVSVFLIGFSTMQIVFGPIADAVGRRPVVLFGLVLYGIGTALALAAGGFGTLLAARAIQGMGAAAVRVLAIAIVRDRFAGREMARVMSLTMMIFIIVPVFAPATGSGLLLLGSWHLIFLSMFALALVIAGWFGLRMPETLHPEYRRPLSARGIGRAFRLTATTRETAGYATAMGLMFGGIVAYVSSSPQILETDVYRLGPLFPVAFGAIAAVMGIASFVNAKLVRRLGMRRLSHTGLLGFTACAAGLLALALAFHGRPPLIAFGVVLAMAHFLFPLTVPNFNTMALEPLGAIAGTASSLTGCYTTLLGAVIGLGVGRAFDGTVLPLAAGYLGLSLLSLAVVLWTERGRLFRPQHPDPEPDSTRGGTA